MDQRKYDCINSKEHKKQQEKMAKDVRDVENRIFWNGMDHILEQKEGEGNGEGEKTVI